MSWQQVVEQEARRRSEAWDRYQRSETVKAIVSLACLVAALALALAGAMAL